MKQPDIACPQSISVWPEGVTLNSEEQALSKLYLRLVKSAVRKTGIPIHNAVLYCGTEKRDNMRVTTGRHIYTHIDFVKKHKKPLEFPILHEMGHLHEHNSEISTLFDLLSEVNQLCGNMHVIIESKADELRRAAFMEMTSVTAANQLFSGIRNHADAIERILTEYGISDLTPEALADMAGKNPERWKNFKQACIEAYPWGQVQYDRNHLKGIMRRYSQRSFPAFSPTSDEPPLDNKAIHESAYSLASVSGITQTIHHAMEYICDEFAVKHLNQPAVALQFMSRESPKPINEPDPVKQLLTRLTADDAEDAYHPSMQNRRKRLQPIISMQSHQR